VKQSRGCCGSATRRVCYPPQAPSRQRSRSSKASLTVHHAHRGPQRSRTILEPPTHGVLSLRRHTTGPVRKGDFDRSDHQRRRQGMSRPCRPMARATALTEGGEKLGIQMPFGCRMGICQSCVLPLESGYMRDLRSGTTHRAGGSDPESPGRPRSVSRRSSRTWNSGTTSCTANGIG
jgi:hypothetical protein